MYSIEICIRGNWDRIDGRLTLEMAVPVAKEASEQQQRKTRIVRGGVLSLPTVVWDSQKGFTETQNV